MILFPSIDLLDGKCVRLIQGDYARRIDYPADPLAVAASYRRQGANWVHVVDLDAAKSGVPTNTAVIKNIVEHCGLRVQIGGGVRTTETLATWIAAGAARVVVGTAAFANWDWFQEQVHDPAFANRVVLGLDARDGMVATHGWTHASHITAIAVAQKVCGWPLAAINYTDIAKDGMLTGPNLPSIRAVAEATNVPVIASGGVGRLQDLMDLARLPIGGAIVGRALYENKFTVEEAIAALAV